MNLLTDGIAIGAVIPTDISRKITIGGITKAYPVYKLRLDLLYYNNQNDRIATWISEYRSEHDGKIPSPEDGEAYNQIIEKFVIESNPAAIARTKENILQVDQREPGVVTYDGRIIDGNRRFTCLRLLAKENDKFNYLETVILEQSVASNTKQIKMLELSIQHGEEGKIDYNPVDILVGLYHDVVETKLLSVIEYARSTNEKPGAVRKKIEIANLMVEYLEFINAPKQYHIVRDLQLYSPLEELSRLLKKCQSDEEAEDLKICVFTNILMRTSTDLGRFIRKFKDVISTPYYEDYIEEQKEIAATVLDSLPPVGSVNSNTIRDLTKSHTDITQALERSIEKALAKAHKEESQNRPVQILEDVNTLLATITVDQFDDFSDDDFTPVKSQIDIALDTLQKLKEYIGE